MTTHRAPADLGPLFRPVDPNVHAGDAPRLTAQCAEVLARLRRGPITAADVWPGIQRLAARVHDLRAAGFNIVTTGTGPVARYALIERGRA